MLNDGPGSTDEHAAGDGPARWTTPTLWAVLVLLAAFVAWQVSSPAALAQLGGNGGRASGMVGRAGDTTALTVAVGGEDLLMVLDGRTEQLLVYRTARRGTGGGMDLLQTLPLPQVFRDARARAFGIPTP